MDHWRSHIPKKNPPKQFCEWSFEQGDRKWQQDELELRFELWEDFFWRKTKCVGARISGGDPRWVHEAGGAPSTFVGTWWVPLVCSRCQKFLNILEKIILNFQGIWRTFIFGAFFISWIRQKTDRKYYFALFILNNRK